MCQFDKDLGSLDRSVIREQMDEANSVFGRGLLVLSGNEAAIDHHVRRMKPGGRIYRSDLFERRLRIVRNHEAVAEQLFEFAILFQRKRRDVSPADSGFVVGKRDSTVADRADNLAG